jgi:hypothetical protein
MGVREMHTALYMENLKGDLGDRRLYEDNIKIDLKCDLRIWIRFK